MKLLSTKAKLGELAPLLFSAASVAKSETLATDIAVRGCRSNADGPSKVDESSAALCE